MMQSINTVAVPPGATIKEQLEYRGMPQKEFALRMGMSEKHISHLINGKVELTPEVALRLESVFGIPAKFWNNLEAIYCEQFARVKAELEKEDEQEIISKFPYGKVAKIGLVPKARKTSEKIAYLRSFFEVAKLPIIDKLKMPGIAFRKTGENVENDYVLAAWAQKAKIEARKVSTKPINIAKLKKSIKTIRSYTVLPPNEFCENLQTIFAECGVALIFLPHIEGSKLNGASFLDGKKIILALMVRGRSADIFWFSLFHELFHIVDEHINSQGNTTEGQEKAADCFAKDMLINPTEYAAFIRQKNFAKSDIVAFAKRETIDPGIVLGRLQKENIVKYSQFHELKTQYQIGK
ncbi:hypothetical protein FACS1894111_06220 [Clostridia bacterium]|nr:hypothetical protein FACS1894111_06220 [Clostridia bacterium]